MKQKVFPLADRTRFLPILLVACSFSWLVLIIKERAVPDLANSACTQRLREQHGIPMKCLLIVHCCELDLSAVCGITVQQERTFGPRPPRLPISSARSGEGWSAVPRALNFGGASPAGFSDSQYVSGLRPARSPPGLSCSCIAPIGLTNLEAGESQATRRARPKFF